MVTGSQKTMKRLLGGTGGNTLAPCRGRLQALDQFVCPSATASVSFDSRRLSGPRSGKLPYLGGARNGELRPHVLDALCNLEELRIKVVLLHQFNELVE